MKGKCYSIDRPIINRRSKFSPRGISWARWLILALCTTAHGRVGAQPGPGLQNNPYGYYLSNFNSSMAVVIGFLVCAFFLMGFFSIYLRRCADSHATASVTAARFRRPAAGLDRAAIEAFPIFVYSAVKDLKIGKGSLECAVCLGEFEDCETLRLLPKCNHVFHPDCISAWLASHVTCPVCRDKLVPSSGDKVTAPRLRTELSNVSNREGSRPETFDDDDRAVVIDVIEVNQDREPSEENKIVQLGTPKPNRHPPRARIVGRLPRPHSTGHSLSQLGECTERCTLRFPEEVRRQLKITMGGGNLKRCSSYDVVFPSLVSSRIGCRSGGEGSIRETTGGSDRQTERFDPWVLSMTPPFLLSGVSVKLPKCCHDGDAVYCKMSLKSFSFPFDCRKKDEESPSRLPV